MNSTPFEKRKQQTGEIAEKASLSKKGGFKMMKFKRILSALLAACLMVSVLPMVSLAVDTSTLHNYNALEGYHLFTDLPTAEIPATTADIYWGAPFGDVFHGMTGSGFSSGAVATSTNVAEQNKIAILYGGVDETYGTYYYLTYTLPDGTAYTFAYSGGYFSQNKLTDGLPSGGWAAKHKLFYDAEQHIFYHRPSADMTVMKALKISATSFKFFTDTVAKVLASGTYPVRLYTTCTSDNVAGKNDTHQWSGSCKYDGCDTKFDYKERIDIVDPDGYHAFDISKLPTEGNSVKDLYLGAAFEANGTFYGMSGTASGNAYPTSSELAAQSKLTIHYGGKDDTYGDYYYVEFTLADGNSYALAYASGYFSQNKLTDGLPSGGWAAKHKMFFDTDYQFFYHRPSADMTVMKGLKISAESKKLFTESVENLKVVSADYSPARLFEACISDNVAGTDDVHVWTGTCQNCGYLFDYQVKPTPDGYHVYSGLPTAENPEITGLSLGGNVDGTFYGLNAVSAVSEDGNRFFTTATEASEQCVITVRYAGNDTIYGDYYNVSFRIPSGDSYALAYAGGYFSQNKLTDGLPSGGWAAKHNMFYDAEGQFFYFVIETDTEIVKKGLKISTASQNIFTEKVENLKVESAAYVPVRLYEPCVSDNVPGKGAAGRWSGACACGFKFDLIADANIAVPQGHHALTQLPTAEGETVHMGISLAVDGNAVFYGMSGSFSAEKEAAISSDAAKQYTFRVIYGGTDETYGDYYYVIYNNLSGTEYALAYASGYLSQNKLLENGEPTDGWAYKHRMYFDVDGQFFYHRPSADMTVMKGAGVLITEETYTITTKENKILNGDTNSYPIRPYVVCTSDGVAGENETHHWSGSCSCGYLFDYEENYVVEGRAPQADTAYFWGVTQEDQEGNPTYFFDGVKNASNFNTQLDMLSATTVYVDVVDGGYHLYFLNESSEKQYICLGKNAADSYKTYIDVVSDAANATVFTWNAAYNTFVATVVKNADGENVDMVLGAYTSGETAYTKISALTLGHLAQEHYFPAQLYVKHMAHEYAQSWSYDDQSHFKACFCGSRGEVTDHAFAAWTMDMDGSGIMYRSCDCGYKQEVEVSAEMPSFYGVSVSLHSSFALNFHVKTDSFVTGDYKDAYMVFEMNGKQTTVTKYTSENDSYVFTFDNLAPNMMNENATATLYATAKDGSQFVLTTQYSVARYCYSALDMEDTNDELRTLLVDILNYGAAAQLYRDGNVAADQLVNADLTQEQKAWGTTGDLRALTSVRAIESKLDAPAATWYGVTLVLGDSIKIRVYFTADDITGLTVSAKNDAGAQWTIANEAIKTKNGLYYADFNYLTPAQMSEHITFCVNKGADAVSDVLHYSIESYAEVMLSNPDKSQQLKDLVDAMIRYGDAAKAYVALDESTAPVITTLADGVTKYAMTYYVAGVKTNAYAVVVNANSNAKVMTVAAPWDEINNEENPVTLYSAFEYKKQLKEQGHNVLAITNGGFFKLSAGSNLPWGMQIINGEVKQEPSKDSLAYSDNWFGVTKDGQFVISNTDGYNNTYKGNIQYGIGGGKLLMVDGVAQSVSGQDSYRTCVGLTENGDLIILCMETCAYEMVIRAFTDLNMGVKTILNMDGGGSTTLYTTDSNWQISYDICGDGLFPRKIADAIAIVAE